MTSNKTLTSISIVFFLATSLISFSQQFASNLPQSTFFHLSINGENLQEKMSLEMLENLDFYQEISKKMQREGLTGKIDEIGVNINSEITIFSALEGEFVYFGMAVPINDKSKIQELLNLNKTEESPVNGITFKTSYSEFTGISTEYLVWIEANYTGPYPEWGADEETYAEFDRLSALTGTKAQEFGISLFSEKSLSLNNSKNFKKSFDSKADANLFFSLNKEITEKYLMAGGMTGMILGGQNSFTETLDVFNGHQYWTSQLFFNEKDITINTAFFPNKSNLKTQKNISKSKPNKDFLKYIPANNLIGVYSLNINSEAVLNEIPGYLAPLLDSFLPLTNGGKKSTSFISTILDEEAIARLITGDLMISVSNWGAKPTTKVSYEYDEDFNYSETVTEGSEDLPDLLFMIGSEDTESLKDVLEFMALETPLSWNEDHFFLPHDRDIPMDMFIFTTVEGLFMTNNKVQMNQIKSGKMNEKVSKSLTKSILSNSQNAFIDFKEIVNVMKSIDGLSSEDSQAFNMLSNNLGSMTSIQAKTKGKSSTTKTVLSFPEGNSENSLVYVFNLINEIYKIEK